MPRAKECMWTPPRKSVRSPGEVVEAFRKKFPQETGVRGHAPSYTLGSED